MGDVKAERTCGGRFFPWQRMRRHSSAAAVAIFLGSALSCHCFYSEGRSLDLDGALLQLSEAEPGQRLLSVPTAIPTLSTPSSKPYLPLKAPGLINSFELQLDRPSDVRSHVSAQPSGSPLGGASLLSAARARRSAASAEKSSDSVAMSTVCVLLVAVGCILGVACVAWAILGLVSSVISLARRAFAHIARSTSACEATQPAAQPKKGRSKPNAKGLMNVSPRLAAGQLTPSSAESHARAATSLPGRYQSHQTSCSSEAWSDSTLHRLDRAAGNKAARRGEHWRKAEGGRARREQKAQTRATRDQHVGNEVGPGSWYCRTCTFRNPPQQQSCAMCSGTVEVSCLPPPGLGFELTPEKKRLDTPVDCVGDEEGHWACRCCSASNGLDVGKCNTCGSFKYATRNSRKAVAIPEHLTEIQEDWVCAQCQLVNQGIHGRCSGCSASKYEKLVSRYDELDEVDAATIVMSRQRTGDSALKHLTELRQRPELGTLLLGDSVFERLRRAGKASWQELEQNVDSGVLNGGVGGDRIEHALWRILETPLLEEMTLLRRVVVCLGSNNLMERQEVPQMLTAIKAVVETILKRGVSVVLLGVLPIEPLEQLEQSRTDFNIGLKQLAAVKSDVNYLDLSEQFMNKQMRKQELFVDYVHLNEKGYKLFANGVVKAANSLY